MTPTDLAALAERVEVATEPSRELDAEIHAAAHGRTITSLEIPSRDGLWARPGRYYYGSALMADAPELTGSIDAALTLLPEGWHVIIHARPDWPCVELFEFPQPCRKIPLLHAATPALALCAAALRARSAS